MPTTGRLLFFYFDGSFDDFRSIVGTWDASTLEGAPAIHIDDDASCEQRQAPARVKIYPERWLAGRAIMTAPGREHPDLSDAFIAPGQDASDFMNHPVNADGFVEKLHERLSGPIHQIGGYAAPVQGPVEYEVAEAALDNQVPPSDPRIEVEARRWELLLQVDSDDEVDMSWGDGGVLYWMARPEDLSRGDASNISFTWQCG